VLSGRDRAGHSPPRNKYALAVVPAVVAALSNELVGVALGVVLLGGLVKGLVGFGYAVASTAVLATVIDPSAAIAAMILPTLVANLTLLSDMDAAGLKRCVARFWPFVTAAMAGTLAGMVALSDVPAEVVALSLGAFTLGYVVVEQERVTVPGESWIARRCFTEGFRAKVGLGLVSGAVFGASNVAVQVVAYLDHLSLDRSTFASVLAVILVGVSSVRVAAAWELGLYDGGAILLLSVLAVGPGFVGVAAGRRLRTVVPDDWLDAGVLLLLGGVGAYLLVSGASGL